ncbi:MAG: hypothetical protein JWN10_40, partial [Solirubrobacterales bacterium]|nr:hypothetical protein [Solirubrobacterales bacterium]
MSVQQISVAGAIERAVRKYADCAAIETTDGLITYRELGERIQDFTARLALLTAPGDFVGIEAVRSSDSITSMLGALRAGRPFVFIDARDSEHSNRTKEAALGINLIARVGASPGFPDLASVPTEWRSDPAQDAGPARAAVEPSGTIGYAIHTSGSTGEPKCVLVRAEPLMPLIADHVLRLELGPRSR